MRCRRADRSQPGGLRDGEWGARVEGWKAVVVITNVNATQERDLGYVSPFFSRSLIF